MSFHARLWLAVGTAFLAGGFAGAYGVRSLYGEGDEIPHPNPEEAAACPPCPDCPTCPTPEPCGHVPPPEEYSAPFAPDSEPPPKIAVGGLPQSVLLKAQSLVSRNVRPCLSLLPDARGLLILTLTVTSSEGAAGVSGAVVTERKELDPDSDVEKCVLDRAKETRFDWSGADGHQDVVLPVRVGS